MSQAGRVPSDSGTTVLVMALELQALLAVLLLFPPSPSLGASQESRRRRTADGAVPWERVPRDYTCLGGHGFVWPMDDERHTNASGVFIPRLWTPGPPLLFRGQETDTGWVAEGVCFAGMREFEFPTEDVIVTGYSAAVPSFVDKHLSVLLGMPRLRFLDLFGTGVTDVGNRHATALEHLEYLGLSALSSDRSLSYVTHLRDLRSLNLRGTNVTGEGLAYLSCLPKLVALDLGHCTLGDTAFRRLGEMGGLRLLRLDSTPVEDSDLGLLPPVHFLDLGRTRVTGMGLLTAAKNTNLRFLRLTDTRIPDKQLDRFRAEHRDIVIQTDTKPWLDGEVMLGGALGTSLAPDSIRHWVRSQADLSENLADLAVPTDDLGSARIRADYLHEQAAIPGLRDEARLTQTRSTVRIVGDPELGRLWPVRFGLSGSRTFRSLDPLRQFVLRRFAETPAEVQMADRGGRCVLDAFFAAPGMEADGFWLFGDSELHALTMFRELRAIELFGTGVSNIGLREVSRFPDIEYLGLPAGVTDRGLIHLEALEHLRSLSLRGCQVTGVGLASFRDLDALRVLDLGNCHLDRRAFQELRELTQLHVLRVDGCPVTDECLQQLPAQLRGLDLSGTLITSAAVPVLSQMKSLVALKVAQTGLSEADVHRIVSSRPALKIGVKIEELHTEDAIDVRGALGATPFMRLTPSGEWTEQ